MIAEESSKSVRSVQIPQASWLAVLNGEGTTGRIPASVPSGNCGLSSSTMLP